jgi:hypothetical protein
MSNVPGEVQPGDFFCVNTKSRVSALIQIGEWLNGEGFHDYDHAAVVTGVDPLTIVEAEFHGAAEAPYHYFGDDTLWSTGLLEPPDRDAVVAAARRYIGTGYSFLDYLALATHRLHIPAPGLRSYIQSTGHMICSQLVDRCELDGGLHLFTDGRWPGYVTPASLADMLLRIRARKHAAGSPPQSGSTAPAPPSSPSPT